MANKNVKYHSPVSANPHSDLAGAAEAAALIVYPLDPGSPPRLTAEQIKAERALVKQAANHPALRALARMAERKAWKLQSIAIQPDATEHERGQAHGAGQVYALMRAWLEAPEE